MQMPLTDEKLHDKTQRTVTNKHELQVLESFTILNKCMSLSLPPPLLLSRLLRLLTRGSPLIGAS